MVTLKFLYKLADFIVCAVFVHAALLKANPVTIKECSSCASKDCLSHANRIIRNLKPDVDPCEDFFSFACGGYSEKFGKDDTRSVYDDTWCSLQILIKDLLENLQPEKGTASDKLKTVLNTCMRKEFSELRAVPDALDFLNEVGIPNWPNVDPNFQFEELSETLGKLAVHGEFSFLTFQPTPYEQKDANSNDLPRAIILPGNYLLNSKIKPKDVHNSVLRILSYFNVDKNEPEHMWGNYKALESVGIQLQNEESETALGCRGTSGSAYTSVNCSEKMDDVMRFLCNFWKTAVETGNLNNYFSEDTVQISCRRNHFYYIENILANLVHMNQKSVADYLSLRFFINHLDDMNLYFHLTKKTFPEDKGSAAKTPEPISRWEYCVGWVIKSMNLALGYEYTRKIFTPSIEKNVRNMIEDYVQSLGDIIERQGWIEQKAKGFLIKELEKLEIGFKNTMKRFRNQTTISDYYNEFYPVKESFLRNVLEYGKLSVRKKKIHFNSFYASSDPYTMDFGFALFLPPTYSDALPKIWNYAALGSIIGHELSHNLKFYFDLLPLDEATETSLNHKMQCYVQQYSQFIMEKTGKRISTSEAKEEIIADNIGWQLTEKVLADVIDTPDSSNLPGLEYSALQLMYISFAQDSCAVLSEEVENEFYASKPHNLQKLRVLGILQNSRMFSETFNCSTKKIMNPDNKCIFF